MCTRLGKRAYVRFKLEQFDMERILRYAAAHKVSSSCCSLDIEGYGGAAR